MQKTDAITLLAIDNKPDSLTTLSAVVRETLPQTRVLTATNGPAGIELAAAEDPDVILLDIEMPDMGDFDVCRRLKADDRLTDIPVVFLTALKTDMASRVKALEAGGEGFLAKPLETAELTAQIWAMTKVKTANRSQRTEKERLENLVAERTAGLRGTLASLLESEERFRDLFEKAPLGYQSLDSDGRFIEVNHAWLETLGYTREEVLGKWFGDFLAPEYVQAFRERFSAFKAEGKVHSEFFMMHKDGSRRYISFEGRIGRHADGSFKQTHCILKDETERKQGEHLLAESEARYKALHNASFGGIAIHDQGVIRECNLGLSEMTGYDYSELIGMDGLLLIAERSREEVLKNIRSGYEKPYEAFGVRKNGEEFAMRLEARNVPYKGKQARTVEFRDITERKLAEAYREMGLEILRILNEPGDFKSTLGRVLDEVKSRTGADAAGLRLQDGEDFPYFAQKGFPEDFLLTENTLAERGAHGGVCRDKDGKVCLECTCGLVISGKTNPADPLFTSGGSFWTNNSVSLLDLPSDQDPRHNPRNECIRLGYASMALIPVRDKERVVGLLHLNARRKGCFTLTSVNILEDIAAHIGAALMRKRAEEERDASEREFRSLAESMPQIVWITRADGWTIYFNQQWVDYTGLTLEESYGHGWNIPFHPDDRQRAWDAWKNATENDATYALDCRLRRADGTYRWWLVRGVPLRDADGKILKWFGTCTDIENIKQDAALIASHLEELRRWQNVMLGREDRVRELKREVNGFCLRAGEAARYPSQEDAAAEPQRALAKAEELVVSVEGESRQSLDHAERSRLVMLSAMEDQQRKADACVLNAQRVESLLRLNRMTGATPQALMDYALEESVRLTRSEIGYLAFLNEDESVLTMHSWSRSAMAECAMAEKPLLFPVADTGLWGEAVRQRKAVITNDYAAANPLKKGCPQGHVSLRRHMNVPVFEGSRIVIVAGVGNKDGEYDLDDVQELTLLMDGLWRLLEHRRSEEALRESEQRYRSLFSGMNEGFALHELLFDTQGLPCDYRFLAVNPAFERLTGLKAENLVGASQRQILPDEAPFWLDVYSKVALTGEPIHVEHYSTQLQRHFEVFAYRPAPNRFATVFNDITERKRIEDVQAFLAETRNGGEFLPFFSELARYLAQSLSMDCVSIGRLEGDGLSVRTVAVWCDGRFEDNVTCALKDTPCGDVVGKQVCCFPAGVCQAFPRDQVLKDLRAESYVGATLFGHGGKPVGLIAVIGRGPLANRPLTEAVLKLVAVRAAGEIERQIVEDELQKLDKLQSVGTLAGGIAHDFNNILLGLFGNISMAMDDLPRDHPSYAFLLGAEKSMTRAIRLTKQLLTFAKGGTPVKEKFSLGSLVEEVARFDLTGSNVSLVCRPAEDLWPVDADRGQIQQVVSNLVINARQAMTKGGKVTITLENADLPESSVSTLRAGRYVKIRVQDEGDGINPKVIDHIFDPYFTTKRTGSGLGLATVWSIINSHGGHIGVVSEYGKGTVFTFYLPAASSPLTADPKPHASGSPVPGRPAKLLVMDDEDSVRDIIVRMLKPCGYTVATSPDAQAAIALYKEALKDGAPFDLVIMDLTIPGGPGGKEVVKELLAFDPNVRAIVSSGYAEDPVMSNPSAYGFRGIVAKPYTASALREAVTRALA